MFRYKNGIPRFLHEFICFQEKTDSEKLSWLEKENKRLIAKNNRFLAEIQEQRAKNEELFRRKCEMTAEICNLKLRLMHFRRIMDKKGIEDYKAIDLKYRDLEKEKKSSERVSLFSFERL